MLVIYVSLNIEKYKNKDINKLPRRSPRGLWTGENGCATFLQAPFEWKKIAALYSETNTNVPN